MVCPPINQKPLFIFISQSGETADSRQVLVKANEMGIPELDSDQRARFLPWSQSYCVASRVPGGQQRPTNRSTAFLQKQSGEANGNAKAQAFDLGSWGCQS